MRLRFRVGLVAALLGLLMLTATAITVSSCMNARENATQLSTQILAQAIGRIDARIQSQLETAVEQSRLSELLVDRGTFSADDLDALGNYFLDALSAHEGLSFLSFFLEATGGGCVVQRTPSGTLLLRFLREQAGGQLELTDYVRKAGKLELLRREPNKRENEARPRPYYVAAKAAHHAVWTETSVFFGEAGVLEVPGVTYATPILRPDGSLLGVLTADFDMRAISQFLGSIRILDHGLAFVVEYRNDGSRRVIAHPPGPGEGGGSQATAVAEVSDRVLGVLPEKLPSKDFPPASVPRFDLEGTTYVGSYRPLQDGDLKWVLCVVAPEEDILGAVWHNNRVTEGIVTVSVLVAALVALWLGTIIARPMIALAQDAEAVGRFQLDSRPVGRSWIVEVETLTTALEEMKGGLRSFRKYVPADLVRELLASGQEAKVGGNRLELTIHFSDIAGFTSIAETLPPEQLVENLGEYLEEMSSAIVASGGTVDKYIGDAIMAFWGAPRPDPDHALHACEAALANRDRLDALNVRWQAAGRPRLDARVALHTGEVVVGNVGGGARLNYTIIGDAVNLASRMEGLNKHYSTRLIISETTWERVKGVMIARPLDKVSVKGKAASVVVYELIGRRSEVGETEREAAERHTRAFSLYLEQKWPEAIELFRALAEQFPTDEAVKILLERCERWAVTPPTPGWDGIERMTTK
jgi:adenylate cyclase